jgi:lysophospholipase L1-like esterase
MSGWTIDDFNRYMRQELQARGPGYCCIIGDSITAAAPLAAVGAKQPINAGIGGARVGDALRLILPTLTGTQPAALLLAIGVNDTKWQFPEPRAQRLSDFQRDYRDLVRGARQLTPNVGLLLIGPVASGMEVGDTFFDPDLILAFNAIIATVATELNVPLWPLAGLFGPDGLAHPHVTYDGVHLSDAGYAIWNEVVARAWKKVAVV